MSILLAARAEQFPERTAIVASEGAFTYRRLLDASHWVTSYKIPKDALVVEELPKNAMGKVSKPSIKTLMEGKDA